jgi:hypothetical protein
MLRGLATRGLGAWELVVVWKLRHRLIDSGQRFAFDDTEPGTCSTQVRRVVVHVFAAP